MSKYVYDIEVYPNYMLIGFMDVDTGLVRQYEVFGKDTAFDKFTIRKLKRIINLYTLAGFNSKSYDDPITSYILLGKSCSEVYKKSKFIIESQTNYWEVYEKMNISKRFESIDLIDVAPGQASLKLYGARLNSKKLQDLPYDPHQVLTRQQANEVKLYNRNDLVTTLDLYNKLIPMLKLRENIGEKYGINVISKSDAQIAEAIFREELTKKGVKVKRGDVPKSVKYKAPDIISFFRNDLNDIIDKIEDTTFLIDDKGSPKITSLKKKKEHNQIKKQIKDNNLTLNEILNLLETIKGDYTKDEFSSLWLSCTNIKIGTSSFNIGIGGLHSQEKSMVVIPKKDEKLQNIDVESYYPSLIEQLELYPTQLTRQFLKVYTNIKKTRLQAKKDAKDKSLSKDEQYQAGTINDVLKITLNGSFGKYGSKYSFLYSPKLLLQITITGQLYLLMLIEELEDNDFKVVSSNTDGVEILRKNDRRSERKLKAIVSNWEKDTGMGMEYGEYLALYARDVNNYVAVYPGGEAKAKGVYVDPEERKPILEKNVEYPIVFQAIRDYLAKGILMEDTIYECKDIARFTSSRNVKGGAVWYDGKLIDTNEYIDYINNAKKQNKALEKRNDEFHKDQILQHPDTQYLGKVVRWYYSIDGKPIFYKTGNKVPKSDGAKPMMELTDYIPKDLDYDKYLQLCNEHLADLGVKI